MRGGGDWRRNYAERRQLASDGGQTAARAIHVLLPQLDEHYRWADAQHGGKFNHLGIEARRRIGQLHWLLERITASIDEEMDLTLKTMTNWDLVDDPEALKRDLDERMATEAHHEMLSQQSAFIDEIETFTEPFYWIAWRARTAVRGLPGLNNFDPQGVHEVRNKLLEHPEQSDSKVYFGGFAWGGPDGPVVKPLRSEHQATFWLDRGLYVNAAEFAVELSDRLYRAVAR